MNSRSLSLKSCLALAALAALPASSALAQTMWTNVTGDFNVAASWSSNTVPTGNVNAANDNGSNNVVLIQDGDPVWSHGDTRAGNGNNTTGAFLQTGSTNQTGLSAYTSWLRLGVGTNSVGYYTLSNGVCNVAGNVEVGEQGVGYLKVAGGTVFQTNASGRFTLGDAPNFGTTGNYPLGTLEMDGGAVNVGANVFVLGDAQNSSSRVGTGNLLMNGGSLNHVGNGNFVVGRQGGKANIIMTAGVINQTNAAGQLRFAVAATTAGTNVSIANLTMSGGTINCAGELDFATDNTGSANGGCAYATNNMSGGAINVGGWLAIGRNGSVGVWNMTGGAVTELGTVSGVAVTLGAMANSLSPSVGIVNQSGGTFTNLATQTWIGENSQATWSLSGSGQDVFGTVFLSKNSGAVGVFNLNGGDLTATQISGPGGNGTFNFNGGRLHAGASSTAFMQNLLAANVQDGGAIIDTANFNITIPQNLQAAGAGGLTKLGAGTLTLSGYNSYTGPTIVSNGTLAVTSYSLQGGGALTVLTNASVYLSYSGGSLPASALNLGSSVTNSVTIDFGATPVLPDGAPVFNVGTLTGSGTALLNIAGTALTFTSGSYPLITFGNAAGLSAIKLGSLPLGLNATLVQKGNTLSLQVARVPKQLAWSGAANANWDTTSLDWLDTQNNYQSAAYSEAAGVGDAVTFDDSVGAGPTTVNLSSTVQPTQVTFNNNAVHYTLTGSGKISNGASVIKPLNSLGSVTLQTANDYTGGTFLQGGSLYLGNNQALGRGALQIDGSTVALASDSANSRALTNAVALTTNCFSTTLGDAVNNGTLVFSGPVDFGAASGSRTMTVNSDVVLAGSFSGGGLNYLTGSGRLIVKGQGTKGGLLTHNGANVLIDGGTLISGDGWRMAALNGASLLLAVTNGGAFIMTNTLTANFRVGYAGGDPFANNTLDIAGTFSLYGTGGNGSLILGDTSANDTLNLRAGGKLSCNAIAQNGTGVSTANFYGGTLMPISSLTNFMQGLSYAYIWDGLTVDTTNFNITIAQPLLAGGNGGLTKLGNGTLTLSGANSYAGPTLVNAGKLVLGSAAAPGGVLVASNATLAFLSSVPGAAVSAASVTGADGSALEVQYSGISANPSAAAGAVTSLVLNGKVKVNVWANTLAVGQFPLLSYGAISGSGSLVLGQLPQGVLASLVTNSSAQTIDLLVSTVAPVLWTGATSGNWNTTTTNWSVLGQPVAFQQGDNVCFDDSASNSTVTMTLAVTPGNVLFSNSVFAYTLNSTGAGRFSGNTSLVKEGTNTLTLSASNDFTGSVIVKAGMLVLANADALGSTLGGTYVSNGATLNLKDIRLGARMEAVSISGQGYNNLGALYSDSGSANGDFLRDLRLQGDSWVGAGPGARFGFTDTNATLTCVGGPYRFTKVGTGIFDFEDATVTVGEVEVKEGTLQVANYTTINPGYGITLQAGSEFRMFNLLAAMGRPMTVSNALINVTSGTQNQLSGAITLNGTGTFQVSSGVTLTLASGVTGNGNLVKTTAGRLTLAGATAYTGSTLIQGGTLALDGTGAIAASTNVSVGAGATLDVSALGLWTLGASQSLVGAGALNGSVQANGTVAPGAALATLTFNNDLALAGATVLKVSKDGGLTNDLIAVSGALAYGGQLQVVLTGSTPLAVNDTFKLFSFVTAPASSFASISLPAGYTWDTTQLAVDGTVKVTGIVNPPQPRITNVSIVNGAIVLTGTNGLTGGSFTLLGSTNVALPPADWLPVLTNTFDAKGNFTITNLINPAEQQMFYRLK